MFRINNIIDLLLYLLFTSYLDLLILIIEFLC